MILVMMIKASRNRNPSTCRHFIIFAIHLSSLPTYTTLLHCRCCFSFANPLNIFSLFLQSFITTVSTVYVICSSIHPSFLLPLLTFISLLFFFFLSHLFHTVLFFLLIVLSTSYHALSLFSPLVFYTLIIIFIIFFSVSPLSHPSLI